jgi:hypothetical protein
MFGGCDFGELSRAGIIAVLTLTTMTDVSAVWSTFPPRVSEMCGEPPITAESLCNVDEGLRETFLLIENIVAESDGKIPDGITLVVRDRQVSAEWYPATDPMALREGLLGIFSEERQEVHLAPSLRVEPQRVWASVLAHELAHSALLRNGTASQQRPADACLEREAQAFKIGVRVFEQAKGRTGDSQPTTPIDRHLSDELEIWRRASGGAQMTEAGLDDLANRHVFLHGYAIDCNWR